MCVICVLLLGAIFLNVTCFYYLTIVEKTYIVTVEYICYIFALGNPIQVGEPVLRAGYFIMKRIETLRLLTRFCSCLSINDTKKIAKSSIISAYRDCVP